MNFDLLLELRTRLVCALRFFSLTLRQLVLTLVCLQAVAFATFGNTLVGVALVFILALAVIRVYEIDPEPVLLLLLHLILSVFMLSDPTSTMAVVITGFTAVHIHGGLEFSKERILIVALSLISTTFLRTFPSALSSATLAVGIAVFRLRPFRLPMISLLGLFLLGLVLLLDRTLGCVLILGYIVLTIALFVLTKVTGGFVHGVEQRKPPDKLFPNGYLPMSSTAESLDLHGHTVTGAMKVIHEYLSQREDEYRYNRSQHLRHATIITGPGTKYRSGEHEHASLIRPTVINFLKINKYRYESPSETPGIIKVDLESHAL
ncbi:hypothetical protein RRG08_023941 [Elysia crispata]|uniref:Smr domain-containing protein n=1 Tax=Elysia crispata TaxID=231223 RepID=A0AAE1D219_9GAST|nr:hypothetical protein RRG08_023941 [Elysia crispata]